MKNLLFLVVSAVMLAACSDTPTHSEATDTPVVVPVSRLSKLSWMLGEWEAELPEGMFVEKWQKETDTAYVGMGILTARNGEVLFTEQLRLAQRDGVLWYIPAVSSQNKGEAVLFREVSMTDTEVVFENPTHDFPKRIVYQKPSDIALYARIEGMQKGKEVKEEFNFKRK